MNNKELTLKKPSFFSIHNPRLIILGVIFSSIFLVSLHVPTTTNSTSHQSAFKESASPAAVAAALPVIANPPTYRGMYVNKLSTILGNTTEENSLISYAKKNGMNTLSFYGLGSLLAGSSNYSKMGSLLSRCRQNGITSLVAVIGSSDTAIIGKYNRSRTSNSQKFTGINLEWEWWNSATTWAKYDSTLKAFYYWSKKQSPVMTNETYIGWFKNPTGIESQMASELVKWCDRILVHDYRVKPEFSYMKTRLDYIGKAAQAQKKQQKIVVIFSAEPVFMGPYFQTNSFSTAYSDIVNQCNATTFTGKSGLAILGWQIFAYTYAKQYRP